MKKSRKEFIKKAHNAACSEWKEQIENEFPKLFKNKIVFQKGEYWTKTWDDGDFDLFRVSKVTYRRVHYKDMYFRNGEILENSNNYEDYYNLVTDSRLTLGKATKEEVEKALIAEAKRRGFDGDSCFDATTINPNYNEKKAKGSKFIYNEYGDWLDIGNESSGAVIYEKGKWAEIVPEKKKMTKKEIEKELGYEIEIS